MGRKFWTAFAAVYTFLAINGIRLTAAALETYDFVADLYKTNQFTFVKLVPWLRSHAEQLRKVAEISENCTEGRGDST